MERRILRGGYAHSTVNSMVEIITTVRYQCSVFCWQWIVFHLTAMEMVSVLMDSATVTKGGKEMSVMKVIRKRHINKPILAFKCKETKCKSNLSSS